MTKQELSSYTGLTVKMKIDGFDMYGDANIVLLFTRDGRALTWDEIDNFIPQDSDNFEISGGWFDSYKTNVPFQVMKEIEKERFEELRQLAIAYFMGRGSKL